MTILNYYASIAVVEIHPGDKVTIESVSITSGECVLSGAWDFKLSEIENIQSVLSGKLIIPLGDIDSIANLISGTQSSFIEITPFLEDARKAAAEALLAYEAFKSDDPAKRKKLVSPEFYAWPESIDFNFSAKYLESIGKMSTPAGTPEDFKKTLSAARLLKHLVDMWQLDEQERNNRKYVEGDNAEVTILPESWLAKLALVQSK